MPNSLKSWAGATLLAAANFVNGQEPPEEKKSPPVVGITQDVRTGVKNAAGEVIPMPLKSAEQIRKDITDLGGGFSVREKAKRDLIKYLNETGDLEAARIVSAEGVGHSELEIQQRSLLILSKSREVMEKKHLDTSKAAEYADRQPKDYPMPWADSDEKNFKAAQLTMKYFPHQSPSQARAPYLKKARDAGIPDGKEKDWQAYRHAMKEMLLEVAKEEIRRTLLIRDPEVRKAAIERAIDHYLEEMKQGDIEWRNSMGMPSLLPKNEEVKPGPDF